MDFFSAEERAKKRTSRLLFLFALAVAGTIAAGYLGTLFLLRYAGHQGGRYRQGYSYVATVDPNANALWRPGIFAVVALATLAVIALASIWKWIQFSAGGAAVAESVGGRRVDPHTQDLKERQLLNVVEEMSIAAGLPVPAVYILNDEVAINAFAAGLTTSDAVVTVTRGTLEKLNRDELQGVLGHEFSHILNGDMRLNVRISAIIFGILVIGLAGRGILWTMRSSRSNRGNSVIVIFGIGLGLLVIGYVGYFFGRIIQASVSRQREYLADASSVQFTRNPDGITGALKKIGGYAVGSSLDTHRAAAIGHFFFAQATPSDFGGLWATHPALTDRIKAIDPRFDGKFPAPPEVVDVKVEPWSKVERMAPRPAPTPVPGALAAFGAALAAAAGTLTPEATSAARDLLSALPPELRTRARSPGDATLLIFGLLLDEDPAVRAKQIAVVTKNQGPAAAKTLEEIEPSLLQVKADQKLPLVQLALPILKTLPPAALGSFADTLDELVQADGKVSTFEFAIQRLILRTLALSRDPKSLVTQIYSFQAVTAEISVVLSALAHASSENLQEAAKAFAEGAAQLKLVEGKLTLLSEADSGLVPLDAALDKLATSSGPIKQRLLMAAAHVVSADGVVLTQEAELLRAIAASLDVPVPPIAGTAAA
ncbi:MAG TPA: M48 family metallopeptidase [Opitutaceae bacterium]